MTRSVPAGPLGPLEQFQPELVVDARAALGEGPVWDPSRAILWWVDILGGLVHAFDPATGRDEAIEVGQAVGAVALRRDGGMLALCQDVILALDPETRSLSPVLAFERESPPRRTNDAKPDPAGRLWVDRMPFDHAPGMGSLLRLEADLRFTPILTNLTIPNGLAWSPDESTMYFVESLSREVTAYDFDGETGGISRGRALVRIGPAVGLPEAAVPDGITVDAEGFVWAAVWNGHCVIRVSPQGAVVARIDLPVSQVSSVCFGGPDLSDLYVTSAREDLSEADAAREPTAGGLFRVRTGFRGLPPHRFGG
jgi:sugar lactone lactonase YvrE